FRAALDSFQATGTPAIMFYFGERPFYTTSNDELDQFREVIRFRGEVEHKKIHSRTFVDTRQFEDRLRAHLTATILDDLSPAAAREEAASGWNTGVLATTELNPVGRGGEIARIQTALRDRTSFVVTGIGGIGKSTVLDAALRTLDNPSYT